MHLEAKETREHTSLGPEISILGRLGHSGRLGRLVCLVHLGHSGHLGRLVSLGSLGLLGCLGSLPGWAAWAVWALKSDLNSEVIGRLQPAISYGSQKPFQERNFCRPTEQKSGIYLATLASSCLASALEVERFLKIRNHELRFLLPEEL